MKLSLILSGLLLCPSMLNAGGGLAKAIDFPPKDPAYLQGLARYTPLLYLFAACDRFTKEEILAKTEELLADDPQCIYHIQTRQAKIETRPHRFTLDFLQGYHHNTCQKCLAMMIMIEQHDYQLQKKARKARARYENSLKDSQKERNL